MGKGEFFENRNCHPCTENWLKVLTKRQKKKVQWPSQAMKIYSVCVCGMNASNLTTSGSKGYVAGTLTALLIWKKNQQKKKIQKKIVRDEWSRVNNRVTCHRNQKWNKNAFLNLCWGFLTVINDKSLCVYIKKKKSFQFRGYLIKNILFFGLNIFHGSQRLRADLYQI